MEVPRTGSGEKSLGRRGMGVEQEAEKYTFRIKVVNNV